MRSVRASFSGRLAVLLALLLLLASAGSVLARVPAAATPSASGPPAYPELLIKAASSAFDLPARVPAGRTLVTLENNDVDSVEADIIRLPAGITAAELGDLATPQAFPSWFGQATFPGGPGLTLPGARTQVVVDLTPGQYAVVSIGSEPQFFKEFEVTSGSDPSAAAQPAADASIQLQEYSFVGLPTTVMPGRHVWQLTNSGTQPHVLFLFTAPTGISMSQVMTVLSLPDGATPPPDLGINVTESDFQPMGGLGVLSPGQTGWALVDLPPGTYMVACFVPDPKTGMPHAMLGMIAVLTVAGSGAATPAASPAGADVPDPSECTVAPRSPSSFGTLMATPAATNEPHFLPASDTPRTWRMPAGQEADEATTAAIKATAREALACLNAGDIPRFTALVSDDLVRALVSQQPQPPSGSAAPGTPQPLPPDQRLALVGVRQVRVLPDGRVTALLDDIDPTEPPHGRGTDFAIFVKHGDGWLIDTLIENVVVDAGTPTT